MGKRQTRSARLIIIVTAVAANLVLAPGGLAFCNPRSGESTTCVHDIDINPKRLTTVEISRSSMGHIVRLLTLHKFLELADIRIAVNQMDERFREASTIGFHYDVPVGSAAKNSDCQIYDLSRSPSQPFHTSLLYGLDCTLATKILLRYTSMTVDMQESARVKKYNMSAITDEQLIELYSSTRYFNTAVS